MYLFGITLYVVGECIGWSIGCIAMKIALEVRNKTVTRESILRVEQMYGTIFALCIMGVFLLMNYTG